MCKQLKKMGIGIAVNQIKLKKRKNTFTKRENQYNLIMRKKGYYF